MSDDVNVWLLPGSETILVTDQTGGVPVEACGWSESLQADLKARLGDDYGNHFLRGENAWNDAVKKAQVMREKLGPFYEIQYDNWWGRYQESENDPNEKIDYFDGDY